MVSEIEPSEFLLSLSDYRTPAANREFEAVGRPAP